MAGSPPLSLWSRKRDLVYFVFFVIHVPIIFCMSLIRSIYGVLPRHSECIANGPHSDRRSAFPALLSPAQCLTPAPGFLLQYIQ